MELSEHRVPLNPVIRSIIIVPLTWPWLGGYTTFSDKTRHTHTHIYIYIYIIYIYICIRIRIAILKLKQIEHEHFDRSALKCEYLCLFSILSTSQGLGVTPASMHLVVNQPLQSLQPLSGSLQMWQTCTPRSAFRGWAIMGHPSKLGMSRRCVPFQDLRAGVNVGFSHNRGRPYFDVVQKNCFPWKLPYIGSKSLILLQSHANPIFKLLCSAGCAIIYSRLRRLFVHCI